MEAGSIVIGIIGVLGSFASIYGAYVAVKAKKEAEVSAENAEDAKVSAEKARDQVVHKQQTTSLVTVLNESKRIQKVFFKYSRAHDTRSFDGADFQKDAVDFESIITIFNESRAMIDDETELEANNVYKEMNELLNNFTTSSSKADKKISGNRIRLALDDIIFKLQKTVEDRNSTIE